VRERLAAAPEQPVHASAAASPARLGQLIEGRGDARAAKGHGRRGGLLRPRLEALRGGRGTHTRGRPRQAHEADAGAPQARARARAFVVTCIGSPQLRARASLLSPAQQPALLEGAGPALAPARASRPARRRAQEGAPADPDEVNPWANVVVMWGNLLYEASQMRAAVDRPWRPALDAAVAKFRAAGCPEPDIRQALANHTQAEHLELPPLEARPDRNPALPRSRTYARCPATKPHAVRAAGDPAAGGAPHGCYSKACCAHGTALCVSAVRVLLR